MSFRLLMTGDIHLGRSSSHTGSSPADQHQTAQTWQRIVDCAIHEKVFAVCLSGDIVDSSNKFWESIGYLERGCRRLADAGIQCIAIAGNHDFDVLAHVADQLESDQYFHVLGRDAHWERLTLSENGTEIVHIDGWSFPKRHVDRSPLDSYNSYDLQASSTNHTLPILGMVHGDLGVRTSRYAPLSLSELFALPPNAWLLGHIHASRLEQNETSWVLYPGSPQALDPGELDNHGPWICEIKNAEIQKPQRIALSSVLYARCEIDLSTSNSIEDIENTISDGIQNAVEHICTEDENPALTLISMRLQLIGRCPFAHRLADISQSMRDQFDRALPSSASSTSSNGSVIIDRIDIHCLPAIELNDYRDSKNVLGKIVRLLDDLDSEQPSPETQDLIRQSKQLLTKAQKTKKDHKQIERVAQVMGDEDAKALLKKQGAQLLSELLSQSPDYENTIQGSEHV